MDAKTIRLRLSGHGDVIAHQDGTFTLGLTRVCGESWGYRLRKAVADEVPGACVKVVRCRRLADRMFERHEVVFRVGPEPNVDFRNAPQRACTEGAWYPTPSAATSAESTGDRGKSAVSAAVAPACREDATAGRDRPFERSLGTRPEFIHSVTAQPLDTEGPNHEVAKAEGAVNPARNCDSPGRRPGSAEVPGRVSPGGMVGRERGRAA